MGTCMKVCGFCGGVIGPEYEATDEERGTIHKMCVAPLAEIRMERARLAAPERVWLDPDSGWFHVPVDPGEVYPDFIEYVRAPRLANIVATGAAAREEE